MVNTCKTCKHWGAEVDDTDAELRADDDELSPEEREAARAALANPKRKCEAIPFYCDPSALAACASVRDGSGYRGILTTRADFGCVLHGEIGK